MSATAGEDLAWCWRLWEGSVALSKYIERQIDLPCLTVLELGCGTGLVSLVAARLGANVIATDVATALPIFVHNAKQNFGEDTFHVAAESKEVSCRVQCQGRHGLNAHDADSEDYCCNVCDKEIDEGIPTLKAFAPYHAKICDFVFSSSLAIYLSIWMRKRKNGK
jgi:hypothetical protein